MELPNKDLVMLFEQLGLDSDQASMDAFFASHSLAQDTKLSDASFWSPSQAASWTPPSADEWNARPMSPFRR